jgi:uncharacterized lipoprotein YmbA
MNRWLLLLLTALLAGGCATTKDEENVSTIPWNRPANWEGQGSMGAMNPSGGGR